MGGAVELHIVELNEPGVGRAPLLVVFEADVADATSYGVALRAIIVLSRSSRILSPAHAERGSRGGVAGAAMEAGWGLRRPPGKLVGERWSGRRGKFGSCLSLRLLSFSFSFISFIRAGGANHLDEWTAYRKHYRHY